MGTPTQTSTSHDGTGQLATKCPRRELFEGLQTVGKAVATRTSLPILTHVLIRQDEETGKVRLTATDLDMWIEHTLPTAQKVMAMDGGGAATAPARNLSELLAAMPEADVELSSEAPGKAGGRNGNGSGSGDGSGDSARALHLRCNRANYKLLGLAPDEFPLLPKVDASTQFTISRGVLRDAIKQVLFAVSTDEARPILTGVLMVYKEGKLRLVATDTHRLAVRDCALVNSTGADCQVVVPHRAMGEIQRLVGGGEEQAEVHITLSGNQVLFEVTDAKTGASTTLISRLIDGTFPSYERVIPQSFDSKLTIERDALLSAIRRASIVARESQNRVVLRTSEGEQSGGERLNITASSGNLGNAFEEVEIVREGSETPLEIAFNAKYLLDVLATLDGEGLHLELTEPLRPGVVRPADNTDYFCVLMPMQVV